MQSLRVAAFSLFAVAGLLSAMLLLGATQPRDHTASATITLHAPQQAVWDRITRVQDQPAWRPRLKLVSALPPRDGHRCWAETASFRTVPVCETLADPPSSRVIRFTNPAVSFSRTWTFTLVPIDLQITRLTLTERDSTGSLFRRFTSRFLFHDDSALRRYEDDLQNALRSH